MIHGTLDTAVHSHESRFVVTTTPPSPPAAGTVVPLALSPKVHGAAACSTVNSSPAIVTVPERASPSLAATEYSTVPSPLPPVSPVSVIHSALETAVHSQEPKLAPTATLPSPPAAANAAVAGSIVNTHSARACSTVNVCPAIVIVPALASPSLVATL